MKAVSVADESTQAYPDMSADTVLVPAPTVTVDGDEITIRKWMESNEALDAQALVGDFYDRLTSDPEIAGYFAGIDMERQRRHFLAAVLLVTGAGLTVGTARAMEQVHRNVTRPDGSVITGEVHDKVIGTLAGVLSEYGVPDAAIGKIADVVAPLRPLIVAA
jgi:hemoglobin